MSGILLIIAFFLSFYFFIKGIKQWWLKIDSSFKIKAAIYTLLMFSLILITTIFIFGISYRHTNPYDLSLLAASWVGLQSWALWFLGYVFSNQAKDKKEKLFIMVSSALYMAPLIFSFIHMTYSKELSAFFEYYIR